MGDVKMWVLEHGIYDRSRPWCASGEPVPAGSHVVVVPHDDYLEVVQERNRLREQISGLDVAYAKAIEARRVLARLHNVAGPHSYIDSAHALLDDIAATLSRFAALGVSDEQ